MLMYCSTISRFLSTLPARGATWRWGFRPGKACYFYPRSPRGERRALMHSTGSSRSNFYPRSPRGERPAAVRHGYGGDGISIHAPREGSDQGWRVIT